MEPMHETAAGIFFSLLYRFLKFDLYKISTANQHNTPFITGLMLGSELLVEYDDFLWRFHWVLTRNKGYMLVVIFPMS